MNKTASNISFTLHSVAIQTRDFDRSFRFYTEVLGLEIVRQPFDFKGKRRLAWISAGPCLIELYTNKAGTISTDWDHQSVGPVNLAFVVDKLEDALRRIDACGFEILRAPFTPPSGDPFQPRCAFIYGPDGEEILLREPADPNGLVP